MINLHFSPPFIFAFLASWLCALSLVFYGHRLALLAIPNERSSHSEPTPTSGGIAILLSFALYLCWRQYALGELSLEIIMLAALGGLIGLLGYIDDRSHIAPYWRLLAHFVAATLFVSGASSLPAINFVGWLLDNQSVLVFVYVIGLVWLINLFNFMDGIDGIAAVEAISVLLGTSLILWAGKQTEDSDVLIALAICAGGFLTLNWAPAKLFMGDIGSGFLGIMLGGFALISAASGAINLWSWTILLAVFISDATVTLLRRAARGEKIYQAHRSHAYQILSRRWDSHSRVSLLLLAINVFWLLPLAGLSTYMPPLGFPIAILAYCPLVVAAVKIGAGTPSP